MAILDFLNGSELPTGLNDSTITLIPKVRNPQNITQCRPIALCPFLYKIDAKANTTRMQNMMDVVIGTEQSTSAPRRMVAYESIHAMKKKRRGKKLHVR